MLRHGQQPYAIWYLATLCTFDGFLPMVPAELIALALMILQPRRLLLVAIAFAVSAATSAGLLATLVASVSDVTTFTSWLTAERQNTPWAHAVSLIQNWGAPVLTMVAVFPDSPRTTIAVAALAGLAPIDITAFVFLGKLLLYGLLALAVRYIPRRLPGLHTATWPGARHVRRALQRFIALRRWVDRGSVHKGGPEEK
jgi:membrane protein YqaA with SNARE-associated domain